MALISANALGICKNLLNYLDTDTSQDARLTQQYQEETERLARTTDIFVTTQTLDSQASKGLYQATTASTHVISVAYQKKVLDEVDSMALALDDPKWSGQAAGVPKKWAQYALAGDFGTPTLTFTPQTFALVPAPNTTVSSGITLILAAIPSSIPQWLEPYLVYRTVSAFARESIELKEKEKAQFFDVLADVWLKLIREKLEV
mgnify:CR=1 FL=1